MMFDETRHKHKFISGVNHHPKSGFVVVI